MFSRPVSSGGTRCRPRAGWRPGRGSRLAGRRLGDPGEELQERALAAPLRPTMPRMVPRAISRSRSRRAQKVSQAPRLPGRSPSTPPSLAGGRAVAGNRVRLAQPADRDGRLVRGHRRTSVRTGGRSPPRPRAPARPRPRRRPRPAVEVPRAEERPAECLDRPGQRVQVAGQSIAPGDGRHRPGRRAGVQPQRQGHRDDVLDVPVADHQGTRPPRPAERLRHQDAEPGRQQEHAPSRPAAEPGEHREHHRQGHGEIDQGRDDRRERQDLPGK